MKPKPPLSAAAALRHRAEAALRKQSKKAGVAQPEATTQRQLHELQVHQIELEMQNLELQEARSKVESEMENYSDLYDFAPVGYVTLDRAGAICRANLTCASLLGIERARLIKRRFGLFVAPADQPTLAGFLTRIFASKVRESCELSLLKQGTSPVEVLMEAVMDAAGQECRVAVTDITERKQAEADRLILSKLESTGILAGGLAHDFNNLLTVILINLELSEMLAPPGKELARRLEEAKKTTLLAGDLTQQLITFAVGGASVRKVTNLTAVIRESASLALSGSRVRCHFTLAENLWPASVDAGQIGQVIQNMVQNAREAMPAGGEIFIRAGNMALVSQEELALPARECVRISIADQGGGIAKAVLPKIFDPYFSTKKRGEQKGMGLGLTICHTVIQKHGGTINVETTVGTGTTFHIVIPAFRQRRAGVKAPLPKSLLRHGKILVMDDEAGVREVVKASLESLGHKVELATDGMRAVVAYEKARASGHPFDVVILDLTVRGGMGGLETVQTLLKHDPAVKAVLMSGYTSDPVVLNYEQHGFKQAMAKPFDLGELREMLSQVMESGPVSQLSHEE